MKRKSIQKRLPDCPFVVEGIDGSIYCADTLLDVINQMRKNSWGMPAKSLNGYMRQIAARVYSWNKITIRTDGVENFAADLNAAAIITLHVKAVRSGGRDEQEY